MGVPKRSLTAVPTGNVTVFVKILNAQQNIFLHGCQTGNLASGANFSIDILPLVAPPDMAMKDSLGPVDDLASPPPDMAMHRFLTVNVPELRAGSRKLDQVVVNLSDSMSNMQSLTTDATGSVKFDVSAMTGPYSVTANAPPANGFQGV